MSENARVLLKIHGRVQGVFFRIETKKQADKLNIAGWVKNTEDGTVECMAEGIKTRIVQFIDWCHQGSKGAQVDKVDIEWQPFQGDFSNFEIHY